MKMKMKKLLSITLLTLFLSLIITSCSKDEEAVVTFAKITVKENGQNKSGVSVYMFDENKGPNTNFFEPLFADKTVITESDGIATFNLQETFDLDIIDDQTTLYFGIFDNDDNDLGDAAITIQKGETKSVTINF